MKKSNSNKNELNTIFVVIIIALMIMIVLLSIFGLKKIINFISKINYTFLASFVSILALSFTIIKDRKERNKSIEATVRAQSQIEFEKRLYDLLNIYDQLLYDLSELNLEYYNTEEKKDELIRPESIRYQANCITKYRFLLGNMEFKIRYFYKYYEYNHQEYDKFIKDIQGLNCAIDIELGHYIDLANKSYTINTKYRNYYNQLLYNPTVNPSFDFSELISIVNDTNSIMSIIGGLISNKKSQLYDEALNCLVERETIMKKNNI